MMQALPDFLPQLDDPTSDLAALMAVPNPGRQRYRAYDGTPVGYSAGCDPLTDETMLEGLEDLMGLQDKRIEVGQNLALPFLLGSLLIVSGRPLWQVAAWSLGAYLAPLPVAGYFGAKTLADYRG